MLLNECTVAFWFTFLLSLQCTLEILFLFYKSLYVHKNQMCYVLASCDLCRDTIVCDMFLQSSQDASFNCKGVTWGRIYKYEDRAMLLIVRFLWLRDFDVLVRRWELCLQSHAELSLKLNDERTTNLMLQSVALGLNEGNHSEWCLCIWFEFKSLSPFLIFIFI